MPLICWYAVKKLLTRLSEWLIDWLVIDWCCFGADSWLHCNDAKMRVVSVDEVRRAQAYILVYVRSQAPRVASAADFGMKLPTSSVPRFSEMHRRSSEDGRMSLKRHKTTVWWYDMAGIHPTLMSPATYSTSWSPILGVTSDGYVS